MLNRSVAVVITYTALPGQAEKGVDELRRLIATVVRTEPDCFLIRLYQDPANPGRILLYEEWTSKEAYLGPHFETPHINAFKARAAEMFAGPPDIQFWEMKDEILASNNT